ncbi:MAG: DUF1559 family PulG-like putative transporter [Pirellulaceae bacterium]
MRSWTTWVVAVLGSAGCLALLLVTALTGQESAVGSAQSPASSGSTTAPIAAGAYGPMSPEGAPMFPPYGTPFSGGSAMPGGGMVSGMMGTDPLTQEVIAAQWQVNQALARYQQTADETERQAIKADLTKALERQFDVQQQRRMQELAEIEGRVRKLRDLIDKRNQAKQSIVSKRCDQLLSELDGLGWIAPEEVARMAGGTFPGFGMYLGMPSMRGMGMGGPGMMGPGMGMPSTGMPADAGGTGPMMSGGGSVLGELPDEMRLINNLKQIALAMHNHCDTYTRFPAAYQADDSGRPLLSWRVLILPFLEQESLYREFRLDEPWDSDHNRKLVDRMPAVFRSPGSKADAGRTNYLTVRGSNTVFPGKQAIGFADITDGTSNTIMVLEVSDERAVEWTKPDDFPYDESDPLAGVVGLRPTGFLAVLCDGASIQLSSSTDSETIRRLFIRNDGQVLQHPLGTRY